MPTRFAKQLAQIIRGGVAIGLPRKAGMQLALRCARDSIPPLRLEILLDVATNPDTTVNGIKKRIRKPWRTVKRQIDALVMLEVLTLKEETETEHETAKDGTDVVKTKTYEIYDLNPDFDYDTLTEMAAIRPDKPWAEM
jgi:hypothetical protein